MSKIMAARAGALRRLGRAAQEEHERGRDLPLQGHDDDIAPADLVAGLGYA